MLFVDYVKVFDMVQRNLMLDILIRRGIPNHLMEVVKCMYSGFGICTVVNEGKWEIINRGLRS